MANKPDGKIVVGPFRGAFPNVFEPKPIKINGKIVGAPVYSILMLFDPSDLEPLKAKATEVAKQTWPGRSLKELKFPFTRGEVEKAKAERKDKDGSFYEGKVVVKASSQFQPGIVGPDRQEIVNPSEIYSGAYYYAEVNAVAYTDPDARRGEDGVKCYLNFLMKYKDGNRIAGRTAADVFAGISGGTSDYDPTGGMDDDIPF
jgi:hypothetical protein